MHAVNHSVWDRGVERGGNEFYTLTEFEFFQLY